MKVNSQGALRVSASAGSGKTYTLSQLYLQKALQHPGAFRGVVAITFTNKAAAELKERVLRNLHQLSKGDPKVAGLATDLGFATPDDAKESARNTLAEILHDFDAFQITTIDSFFQRIFSGLAYEIGLPSGLQPDLDQDLIKNEILDTGLRQMDVDTQKILLENILEMLENSGKGWRTTRYLETDLLNNLFQDVVIDFQQQATSQELSAEAILEARKKLSDFTTNLTKEMADAAAEVVAVCQRLGFDLSHLGSSDDIKYLNELQKFRDVAEGKKEPFAPSKKNQEGTFYAKPKSKKFSNSDLDEIAPALQNYGARASSRNLANLTLAKGFLRHLSAIRLLIYFREVLKQRNLDTQRYLLQEVKYILKNFIGGEEVPYLFEKLGNRIHSLMIDEFQDTDRIQWKVIFPLAKSVLDNGGFFAVVGDVKQSIYNWRGADSTLFKSGMEEDLFPIRVKEEILENNFRSETRIVEFNNWVFDALPDRFFEGIQQVELARPSEKWKTLFQKNYENHAQKPDPGRNNAIRQGFVELRVRDRKRDSDESDEEESAGFSWVIPEVKRLQDSGIPGNEIAILVRNNRHLKEIVNLLDQAGQEKSGYDFRYSSAADIKQGEHLLMRFLFLALQYPDHPDKFHLMEMEALAVSLGLGEAFGMAKPGETSLWRKSWEDPDFQQLLRAQKPTDRLQTCIAFFKLTELPQHHSGLVEFTNRINRYMREESGKYPDFSEWWNRKASQESLQVKSENTGIQVVSIHKSKGLEFGVVILAIDSTATGEKNHQIDFWPKENTPPWNAFPLMKAPGKKEFIDSDLGESFSELVYANQLEKLNVWYVALTRPRFGLIVDISLDCKLNDDKSPTKWARPAFLLPRILMENEEELNEVFPGCKLETNPDPFLLRYSYGEIGYVESKKKESDLGTIPSRFTLTPTSNLPWKEERTRTDEEKIGELTHRVLEKTNGATTWKTILDREIRLQNQFEALWPMVEQNLERLFSNENLRSWFSKSYQSYAEHELLSETGEILRVDRILISETELVVLDFKTGVPLSSHKKQIMEYARILEKAFDKKPSVWLVYTQPVELVEILA